MMNEKSNNNWDLMSDSEENKTIYLCFVEKHPTRRVSYVVRSIKLSQLFRSENDDSVLELNKVGYKYDADGHLAASVGCGVFGSQIVFAAGITSTGITPATYYRSSYQKDAYALETQSGDGFIRMDGRLLDGKVYPIIAMLGGKLIAHSYQPMRRCSFEVFDSEIKTWRALPEPPFWGFFSDSNVGYAIIGTKMFMSYGTSPIYCFDIAQENRNWRRVDSMRGPFKFHNDALVLDLPGHPTNKLMFACDCKRDFRWRLGVYMVFLDEGRESMTEIARCSLPGLPSEFEYAGVYYTRHIGGQKCCLVAPLLEYPEDEGPLCQSGSHKTTGVVVPFEFRVDFNKIGEDIANCLTLEFKPTRVFEFYTSPSTFPQPNPHGCFIL